MLIRRIIIFILLVQSIITPVMAQDGVSATIQDFEQKYEASDYSEIVKSESKYLGEIEINSLEAGPENFYKLGYSFLQVGQPAKAEVYFGRSIDESIKNGSEIIPDCYYQLLKSKLQQEKYRTAEEVLKILNKSNDQDVYTVLANTDYAIFKEEYEEAEEYILDKYKSLNRVSDAQKALVLDQLGRIYQELRLENKARSYFLESFYILNFSEEENNDEQLIFNLKKIGDLYMLRKEYEAALNVYSGAMDKASALSTIKDQDNFFRLRENLLVAEIYTGSFLQGLFTLNQLIEEESTFYGKFHENIANLFLIQSEIYLKIENEEEAINSLNKAEEILSLYSYESEPLLKIYSRKATFFENSNRTDLAIENLEKGLDIIQDKFSNSPVHGNFEFRIARQLSRKQNWNDALDHLTRAKEILSDQLGEHHPDVYEIEIERADVLYYKGQISEAMVGYSKGVRGMLSCYYECSPAFSEQQKIRYKKRVEPNFFKLIQITMQNQDTIPGALINDLYSLHISLDNLLFERDFNFYIDLWSTINDERIQQSVISWLDDLDRIKNYYLEPLPFKKNQEKIISNLRDQVSDNETYMSKKSVDFQTTREYSLKTWEIVSKSLEPGQVAIEVTRFPDYDPETRILDFKNPHYAYFIIKPGIKAEIKYNQNAIELETKYLSYLRGTLDNAIPDYYSYDTYWKPIEPYTENAKAVYFSAEGAYCLFNLNALQNPEDSSFVLDNVDIRYVNSTWNVTGFNPQSIKGTPEVYLFGKPNVYLDRQQVAVSNPYEVRIQYDPAIVQYQKEDIFEHIKWNKLVDEKKGRQDEIMNAYDIYQANNIATTAFSGADVKEFTIKGLVNIRSFHFTASGYFLENQYQYARDEFIAHPLNRSGLILSGAYDYLSKENTYDYSANEDGLLTSLEIRNLNLNNSELVFLTATDCNLGIIKNWESVKYFQQSFHAAGANSIVMTLWNADSEVELEVIRLFYKELLAGNTVHASFRKVQKEMREKYVHPSKWGSFIYLGE